MARVLVSGGVITGITDIAVADGGTGSSTASGARTNLGLGTIAVQAADAIAVTGGSALLTTAVGYGTGGTIVQATNRTTGVTLNEPSGRITLVSTVLAAGATDTFTLTNSSIAATDIILLSVSGGASVPYALTTTSIVAGSCVIAISNFTGGNSSAEAPIINFAVFKAATA
jgi:hypothetical protein